MKRDMYARNAATIRRLAKEIIDQCDHYDRNTARGYDDTMRVAYMLSVGRLAKVVGQARRRWDREHGI